MNDITSLPDIVTVCGRLIGDQLVLENGESLTVCNRFRAVRQGQQPQLSVFLLRRHNQIRPFDKNDCRPFDKNDCRSFDKPEIEDDLKQKSYLADYQQDRYADYQQDRYDILADLEYKTGESFVKKEL